MIGVEDVARSKAFYADGLGCEIAQDHGHFALLNLGDGSSSIALYPWAAAAGDAGVPAEGSGFRGFSLHYIVASNEEVDDVIARAVAAGGSVVKEAKEAPWGGYFGYFSDPDGYLWKVACSS
jgi:catechol 2,3-dioxygenase-like lactoylglutathione lyase family enzyme